ncbi:MAG: gliding motility protein [Deltaproteobacteria bacterium]|nr:gliding motility protein [Deltaproteobacteria bacterium]
MFWMMLFSCDTITEQYNVAADPSDDTEFIFTVPKGANARKLGTPLQKEGIIDNGDDFVTYIKLSKEGSCIKAGNFSLRRDMTPKKILETMCGTPLANDKAFTILEGWRIKEIDDALTKEGWIKTGEYKKAVENPSVFSADFPIPNDTLEGYLYPETYMLSPARFTVQSFVQRQLDTLDKNFYTPNKSDIKSSKRSFHEIIIMASMLEREEPTPAQRPLVSGIIWKRLDNNWNLGIDATSRYTLDVWNDRKAFLKKLRDPKDPYNTRLKPGLPPTPIGNASTASMEAALNPKESEYWYYLHDANKILRPAKNAKGHERNRRKYNVY